MRTVRGGEGGGGEDVASQMAMVPRGLDNTGPAINFGASSTPSPSLSTSLSSSSSAASPAALQFFSERPPAPVDAAPAFLSQQLPYAHLLDTLPYVDALSPEQHEAAKLLVQQEMAAIRKERSSRRQQQQSSGNGSGSSESRQQQQHRETGEEESASAVTGLKASAPAGAASAGKEASAAARVKQQTAADSDAAALEDVLQSYLKTFPLPCTPHLDDPNTLAGKELARLARGESMQKLDLSRYEALPSPPPAGIKAQESEWRKSVDSCEGLLEHLGIGQTNLELMNLHAVSLWMRHLHNLTLGEQHWSAAAKRVRAEVDRVSKQRKLDQVECSGSLRDTARMREDYERRNEEILAALGKLQQEVVELKVRCHDRGVLPDDYDSDFEEDFEDWEALLTSSSPSPAPAPSSSTENSGNGSGCSSSSNDSGSSSSGDSRSQGSDSSSNSSRRNGSCGDSSRSTNKSSTSGSSGGGEIVTVEATQGRKAGSTHATGVGR